MTVLSASLPSAHVPYHHLPYRFFCSAAGAPRDLHSFPTRRSSDLRGWPRCSMTRSPGCGEVTGTRYCCVSTSARASPRSGRRWARSEEHTSELQSPCNLVCRLLLEKKK